ncbi:hypothetical protein N7471_005246 [Penicillium samsonianum]|uniref:uncharacterized protein n=1 Tax=Penicillium samsonianum TaxID=1882272 RepID=UPI0025493916|nr:uncharacterized protein N7471_005246 [Penicillium samsonianum]KAJ6138760.1 hypothetical protein N7471_005246 [Penicillium samsonianum]
MIYIVSYASVSSSSEARTLTKIIINDKDSLEIRRKDPRGGPPVPIIELTPKGTKKFLGQTKLYGEQLLLHFPRSFIGLL